MLYIKILHDDKRKKVIINQSKSAYFPEKQKFRTNVLLRKKRDVDFSMVKTT